MATLLSSAKETGSDKKIPTTRFFPEPYTKGADRMRKKLILTGFACALVLGGSGAAYQAYAAQAEKPVVVENVSPERIEAVSDPLIPADPNAEQFGVELSDVPAGELLLPPTISLTPETNSFARQAVPNQQAQLEQQTLNAQDLGTGLTLQSTYEDANGKEYLVYQYDLVSDVNTTIEEAKGFYSEPVQDTEIANQPAIYVDGQDRRVVHFFKQNKFFSVSSWDTSIDETLSVANAIATQ